MTWIGATTHSSASIALRLLTEATALPAASSSGGKPSVAGPSAVSAKNEAVVGDNFGAKYFPYAAETRITVSLKTAEKFYGSDSFLMQTAGGRADTVEIAIQKIPSDKEAYRAQLRQHLETHNAHDAEFMAALKAGKVVIQTMDEVPELNFQPMVGFTMYKNGSIVGSGGFTPPGFNFDQLQQWEATRTQYVLADAYAYYLQ